MIYKKSFEKNRDNGKLKDITRDYESFEALEDVELFQLPRLSKYS